MTAIPLHAGLNVDVLDRHWLHFDTQRVWRPYTDLFAGWIDRKGADSWAAYDPGVTYSGWRGHSALMNYVLDVAVAEAWRPDIDVILDHRMRIRWAHGERTAHLPTSLNCSRSQGRCVHARVKAHWAEHLADDPVHAAGHSRWANQCLAYAYDEYFRWTVDSFQTLPGMDAALPRAERKLSYPKGWPENRLVI